MSNSIVTLSRVLAISETDIIFVGVYDEWDVYEPASRISSYRENRKTNPWVYTDFLFHTASLCQYSDPENKRGAYFVALSSEGEVYHHGVTESYTEQIKGAGLENDDAVGYGRMTSIRQIGDRLYACGNGGQLYIRNGKNDWQTLSKDLRWDPDQYVDAFQNEPEDEDAYDDWYDAVKEKQGDVNPNYMLNDINGPSEDEIYICGEGGLLYGWNGEALEDADADAAGALNDIHVTKDGKVWICGRDGQLFFGNEDEGLEDYSDEETGALFTSVTTYQGRVILASMTEPFGLFEFDAENEELKRITPRVKPVLRTIHTVQSVGDVLWLVGTQDILRLKNGKWERIQHPDMPVPKL